MSNGNMNSWNNRSDDYYSDINIGLDQITKNVEYAFPAVIWKMLRKDEYEMWFYSHHAEAKEDDYKKFDWRQNPWAALPQWLGFSAVKPSPRP